MCVLFLFFFLNKGKFEGTVFQFDVRFKLVFDWFCKFDLRKGLHMRVLMIRVGLSFRDHVQWTVC